MSDIQQETLIKSQAASILDTVKKTHQNCHSVPTLEIFKLCTVSHHLPPNVREIKLLSTSSEKKTTKEAIDSF